MKPRQSARASGALSRRSLGARTLSAVGVAGITTWSAGCGGGGAQANTGPTPAPAPVPSPSPSPAPAADLTSFRTAVAKADPGSQLPARWWQKGVLEIYVRGYQDSNGDGIGDIRGLISRLDHIRDLGVGGIWLMPVNTSQDKDHGYAVANYRDIEPDYGTLADFDELIRQAHTRGLGVMIDYLINHSAATHPAFVDASSNSASAFRNWYLFDGNKPAGWSIYGGDPWRVNPNGAGFYFAPFSTSMPDFNLRNAETLAWHHDNMRFWLNRGVDGFRLDAVGHLVENGPNEWDNQPQNHVILKGLQDLVSGYANRYLVCEAPGDSVRFAQTDSCGSAFAFKHQEQLMQAARGANLDTALPNIRDYWSRVPERMAPFLSNHDGFAGDRVWQQLGGDTATREARYKLAAASYLLGPGVPFTYYGEETGLGATGSGDRSLRTPMPWTSDAAAQHGFSTGPVFRSFASNAATASVQAQAARNDSILATYKALFALRNERASIRTGSYANATLDGQTLSYQRTAGSETSHVLLHYGSLSRSFVLNGLEPNASYRVVYGGASAGSSLANASGQLLLSLPALSAAVVAKV